MKVLIDTCVILDVLQSRKPFCEDANSLFLAAANNRIKGYISANAITDIYYIMHRYTHDDKTSREIINKLFVLFDVLDTLGTDCKRALLSKTTDYEDAVMIETALRSGVDYIVTRNISDYSYASIKVCTPGELLKIILEDN